LVKFGLVQTEEQPQAKGPIFCSGCSFHEKGTSHFQRQGTYATQKSTNQPTNQPSINKLWKLKIRVVKQTNKRSWSGEPKEEKTEIEGNYPVVVLFSYSPQKIDFSS